VPAFVGWDDPGAAFTAVTQLGTMAAVLIYFRKDLLRVLFAWTRSLPGIRKSSEPAPFDARLGWYLGLGTIPVVVFGFLFRDQIETAARDLYLIGGALIVMGLVLGLADLRSKRDREIESMQPSDAAVMGFAQALALIPGVSRSGATISAGLFRGMTRPAAARYSFLLSVPAVVLSGLYELPKALEHGPNDAGAASLLVATLLAFIVGYASIAIFLRWLGAHSTAVFVVYRVVLGIAVIALASSGAIT